MSINVHAVAVALRALADAIEEGPVDAAGNSAAGTTTAAEPQKRGRGRPAKGEGTAAPAASEAPPKAGASTTEADPFAATAPAAPVATLDEVRKALTELRAATDQAYALQILKLTGGVDNITALKPEQYGNVVVAAKAAKDGAPKPPASPEPADPFASPAEATAPAAKPLTLEDVRAVIVEAQKRTSQDTVQKIVMQHGGKAPNPATGGEGPSLKALPPEQFAAVIAAIKNLPTTK